MWKQPDYLRYYADRTASAAKALDGSLPDRPCLEEIGTGNQEFSQAEQALRASVEDLGLPEIRYFMETFVPSFKLTLDELK